MQLQVHQILGPLFFGVLVASRFEAMATTLLEQLELLGELLS